MSLVLLGLGFSVPSQEIGWEERLRNDLYHCMERDVKPCSIYLSCCPALMNLQRIHLQSVSLLHLCKFASIAVIMRKTGE